MELQLNSYGNVDVRNGIPDGWVRTGAMTVSLKAAGIEVVKGLEGFAKSGKYYNPLLCNLIRAEDVKRFEEWKQNRKPKRKMTAAQKLSAWARRLSKLTGISVEDAEDIAREKLNYQHEKIMEMEDRQCSAYSPMRAVLINRMMRENPLRRIVDRYHANAILEAHHRHTGTDYEARLRMADELCEMGEADRSEKRELARTHSLVELEGIAYGR